MPKIQRESIRQWVKTYCPYCGVGCGLLAGMKSGSVAKIKGDPDHPSSLGDLCLKAVYLPETLSTPDRLLYPQMRRCQDGPFTRVSWETAIKFLAERFRDIIDKHGRDAVAFYGSGQLTTEEYYIGNKLAKGFLGTNNFDTNSRLCMASAAAGYQASLGSDGPPACYADLDVADCFFLIGTNTADCHPVTFKRTSAEDGRSRQSHDHRRRSTPDRNRDFADLHLSIRPVRASRCRTACLCHAEENLVDRDLRDTPMGLPGY
jgi:anaerobic selenocysteine-containing dehydrogenase